MTSEVGVLLRVLVHRPGLELRRLNPENKEQLLFDDVVWPERAQEEHDALTGVLRGAGAEVVYLADLLADVLDDGEVRTRVLNRALAAAGLGPTLTPMVGAWLAAAPAEELVGRLIGGITYDELPFTSNALVAQASRPDAFLLPPLPNQMFTRDTSTWVSQGVFVHSMSRAVRRRETFLLDTIYRHHALFANSGEMWSEGICAVDQLEGGDVLVIGESTLLVGMGERTSPVAVELYARRLFEAGVLSSVIAVVLPRGRASIHLDSLITMVDVDAFMIYPPVRNRLDAFLLRPSKHGVSAEPTSDLFRTIERQIGRSLRLIGGSSDRGTARREQWDEGTNLLAVAPGKVVAYERNPHANADLAENGIEVITVPSSEIARGRGGPRCLTCPIAREPL